MRKRKGNYLCIKEVYDTQDDKLAAIFDNGDEIKLESSDILKAQGYRLNLAAARVIDGGFAIMVPAIPVDKSREPSMVYGPLPLVVSAIEIRKKTDPAFAADLQKLANKQEKYLKKKKVTKR